ncbi:uncharacterized protein BDZ99DRAFT_517859 [Mytilinidion resinicola]|uniref:SAM domain-containing protein n=1 Tax=Mytilinidion resinicola TaxID=574789 RepID=A0A6A6YYU6_9PEZI|nr:uncharacterized protein BDZ99DRAFT_517859 [Mytilinidion resinicola]KAF2813613.1 hypothetical protein BDZ99DRAFT_517859 [Mytilinidion resinicola]
MAISSSWSLTGEAALVSPEPNVTNSHSDFYSTLWALGLSEYLNVLRDNSFWDRETLLEITDDDMKELGFKLGHQRIMQREIAAAGSEERKSRVKPENMELEYMSRILEDLFLYKYKAALENNGFNKWSTILEITEDDLKRLGFKIGHRRLLQREIAIVRGRSDPHFMVSEKVSSGNSNALSNFRQFAYATFTQQGRVVPERMDCHLYYLDQFKDDNYAEFLRRHELSAREDTYQLFWMLEASTVQRIRD